MPVAAPHPACPDDRPYRRLEGAGPVLLLCDHASNRIPPGVGDLGLPPAEMARHIAYDIGAAGVVQGLAARLGARALLTRFSRLVIDPNRGPDDPTLVMRLYDRTIIPGNASLDAAGIEARRQAYYGPYHAAIAAELDAMLAAGLTPAIVSVHSFTPQLRGRPPRPWHVGILWDGDGRLARPALDRLRAMPDLVVGENEPYAGQLVGDTLWTHGTRRGIRHLLIEIRQDLIDAPAGQAAWAERLAPVIAAITEDQDG